MHPQEIDIPFDPIITLIVFLIGVPALVFQSMSPDVRRIFFERRRLFAFLFGLIVFPVLSALVVSGIGIYTEINSNPSAGASAAEHAVRWIIVLSTLVVVILIVAIYFPLRYGRRQGVLRLLEREILWNLWLKGRLPEEAVEDIIDLGKNAESPQEKSMVLQTIHNLVLRTCKHRSYTGDNLETLILNLHEIVIVDSQPANLENFRMTAEILQAIAVARKEIQHVADLQRTVKAVSGLGCAALMKFEFGLEIDNVIMSFIQTLSLINYIKPLDVIKNQHIHVMTDVSEALFEIGSLAAEKQRDFITVAALDKLVTILCQTPMTKELPPHILNELSADVMGLMAHIWSEGDSQKEFVRRRMPDVQECLGLSISRILGKACFHYAENSQFATANKLAQMAKDLKLKRKPLNN
ncbi:MAG: hypothetical protein EHM64_14045 [Ignavibacteriae bacterium]|nr:MAG: hypothetical protein EHM64_14045 [Ignavibacteriota bacterium]